jgi:adenylate cyclase
MELMEPAILYFHRRALDRAVLEDMVVHLREDLAPYTGEVGEIPLGVLFVDLTSFTPMTEAMGDAEAVRVLDRFSDLVREAAGHCGGRVLKQIGDEFMIVFPSGAAAITCGIAVAHRAGQEPQFPAVRIGAHSGTALYREADYLGATVNTAARVVSEAGRGQFLVTQAVCAEAENLRDVQFESIGERTLKGVAQPLELFAVHHSDLPRRRAIDPVCGMELDEEQCDTRVRWGTGPVLLFGRLSRTIPGRTRPVRELVAKTS